MHQKFLASGGTLVSMYGMTWVGRNVQFETGLKGYDPSPYTEVGEGCTYCLGISYKRAGVKGRDPLPAGN